MKTLILTQNKASLYQYKLLATFALALTLWLTIPNWLQPYPHITFADPGIWHLILLGMLLWLLTQALSTYLFHKTLIVLGFPTIKTLILEFNTLTTWQKYILYYVLFTLWWLTLLLCLMAIL